MLILGVSSENKLLEFSLEAVAIEGSTVVSSRNTIALEPTTRRSGSDPADRLAVSSLKTIDVEQEVASSSHSISTAKPSLKDQGLTKML